MSTKVSLKDLLDAGVHFGHQTHRWNPKMKPYIFTARSGIYILDLKQTIYGLDDAITFARGVCARGQQVLFVGTKKQATITIKEQADRASMPYVNYRWMGGMLTNFKTISNSVKRMEKIEAMIEDGTMDSYNKKEQGSFRKQYEKLNLALGGIRSLGNIKDVKEKIGAVFVVDTVAEDIAVKEAMRLNIPIIAMLDTNSDPDDIEYGIPANDDAMRSIELITTVIADACIEGAQACVSEADFKGGDKAGKASKGPRGAKAPAKGSKSSVKKAPKADAKVEDKTDEKAEDKADKNPKDENTADEKAAE
ncbi:MAG: 30S ribosomal protein S2 [Coriobacteriales bacterium]|nr:30S ribosomal protein S2 [Coriobacteriales bacterium]